MGKRRQAREMAMQALYFLEEQTGDPEQAITLFCRNFSPPRKTRAFFYDLVKGVHHARSTIDGIVEGYSDNWKVFRMPRVDRNVIRLAVYEMLSDLYDIESKSCDSIIENVEGVHDGRTPQPIAKEVMVEPFDADEEWMQVSY